MRLLVVLLSAVLAAADDFGMGGGGFGGLGGEPQNCPAFRCSKGSTPVPKRQLKLTSTGCQSMGGGMQMFSPGGDKDEVTRECCDLRNACYQTCGASRKTCEKDFKACTTATCEAAGVTGGPEAKKECDSSSSIHVMMASLGNCDSFTQQQNAACQCLTEDKAPARREKVLTDFYNAHNPEKAGEAPKMAAKASSARSFAQLLSKLIAKYPKAVVPVKDTQNAWMEDIMKNAKDTPDAKPADVKEEIVEDDGELEGDDAEDLDSSQGSEL